MRIFHVTARTHIVHRAVTVQPLYQSTISLPRQKGQTSRVIELREEAPGKSRSSGIAVGRFTTQRREEVVQGENEPQFQKIDETD